MTQLDEMFRARRAGLRDAAVAQATTIWRAEGGSRNRYLGKTLTLVEGAQRAVVQLTSAYLTAKSREQLGTARYKSLNLDDFTVAKLRGVAAVEVYARPFGVLYGQLNEDVPEDQAQLAAIADLSKLVATDVQMAYTAAAQSWMAGDSRIGGYQRILAGTCDYCEAAADGLYQGYVQMPIHENCECDLEPVFGSAAAAMAATGLAFHAVGAGTTSDSAAGDLPSRLDTTGAVPAPPKRRHGRH